MLVLTWVKYIYRSLGLISGLISSKIPLKTEDKSSSVSSP